MKISFVIPAYNEEFLIADCIESVLKALDKNPCEHEVIVVNNASTDRTSAIAASYEKVRVVDEPQKGLVWARKAGFDASTGDIIANIDSDTILPDAWLATVLDVFKKEENLLALSGPYIYYDVPWHIRMVTKTWYIFGFFADKINSLVSKSESMFQGGNFVLRRSAFEDIGGFDTSIEFHGEDIDIGRRLRKIGKVRWTFALPMYSSGRRLMEQGVISTGINYFLNVVWMTYFKKPLSKTHIDIRARKRV